MGLLGIITGILGIVLAIYSLFSSKKSDKKILREIKRIFEFFPVKPQRAPKGMANNKKVLKGRAKKILAYLKKNKTATREEIESFFGQPFENLRDDINLLRDQGVVNVNVVFTAKGRLTLQISLE